MANEGYITTYLVANVAQIYTPPAKKPARVRKVKEEGSDSKLLGRPTLPTTISLLLDVNKQNESYRARTKTINTAWDFYLKKNKKVQNNQGKNSKTSPETHNAARDLQYEVPVIKPFHGILLRTGRFPYTVSNGFRQAGKGVLTTRPRKSDQLSEPPQMTIKLLFR